MEGNQNRLYPTFSIIEPPPSYESLGELVFSPGKPATCTGADTGADTATNPAGEQQETGQERRREAANAADVEPDNKTRLLCAYYHLDL